MSNDVPKTSQGAFAPNGYSLWEYTGSVWALKKDVSISGGVPGTPPRAAGLFKGQIRAVPSVAQ